MLLAVHAAESHLEVISNYLEAHINVMEVITLSSNKFERIPNVITVILSNLKCASHKQCVHMKLMVKFYL